MATQSRRSPTRRPIRQLRAMFARMERRARTSPLGRYALSQARDPEVRQAARDIGSLIALYQVAKRLPGWHGRFKARVLGGEPTAMDVLREAREGERRARLASLAKKMGARPRSFSRQVLKKLRRPPKLAWKSLSSFTKALRAMI